MAKTNRRIKIAKVVSDKMNKTRVVTTERKVAHKLYGKLIKKTTSFKVHDEKNESKIGDTVKIVEFRPLSKTKRWQLVEIVERAK
ncbi:MAG: 30S ribosomal protein S17 [bacterium]|nr:30S ribosomal protein S17 [bacterium]MDD5756478.1 30S ribosomal protein S17 [bacterium]